MPRERPEYMKGHDYRWHCAVEMRDAIGNYTVAHGYPPSVRNLQAILGLSSTSLVVRHMDWAIKFGIIEHSANMARTVRLPRATA